jgi:ferredoxin-NADP reductase
LLALILVALLLQIVTWIVVASARRRASSTAGTVRATAGALRETSLAWPGWRGFRIDTRAFEDARRSQCSFLLAPVDGQPLPPFSAGQFLTFQLPVTELGNDVSGDAIAVTRTYSLSDASRPERYRITIKRALAPPNRPDLPPGVASTFFHDRVQIGDVIQVRAPSGRFVLVPDASVHAVMIAGGIGVTPMMSMIHESLVAAPERPIHLYYGVRSLDELAFGAELETLVAAHASLHVQIMTVEPPLSLGSGRLVFGAGRITLDLLQRTLPAGNHHYYVCGPAPMMEAIVPALIEWGVPSSQVRYEAFGPASIPRQTTAGPTTSARSSTDVDVRFRRSARLVAWAPHDGNLLDFAQRHGVPVDGGCRAGVCGTCETRLLSGTVHYDEPPTFAVADGHCLLCVSTPASPLELDA